MVGVLKTGDPDIERVSFKGFISDNKFRNKKVIEEMATLEDELVKEKQELAEQNGEKPETQPVVEPEKVKIVDPQGEETWKKRYGDLQRYSAKKDDKFKADLASLKNELDTLKKNPATNEDRFAEWVKQYPDDVANWMKKYPDVASVVKQISVKENESAKSELQKEIEDLKQARTQLDRQRAYQALLVRQPDFETLRSDSKFADWDEKGNLIGGWMFDQPDFVQNAIFNPTYDNKGVVAASRVIDLYKNETKTGSKSPVVSDKEVEKRAATHIKGGEKETPEVDDKTPRFTESQVQRMSDKDYVKNEKAIEEAIRKGPPYFVYDLSQAR